MVAFITIAVARFPRLTTVALKGIGIVLTPFTALISLFATFGPIMIPLVALVVLFWEDQRRRRFGGGVGAEFAAGNPAGIGLLFKGDFAGFWEAFSTAAVAAFQTIARPRWIRLGLKPWLTASKLRRADFGTLQLIGQAYFAGRAATGVANIFNKLFGTD